MQRKERNDVLNHVRKTGVSNRVVRTRPLPGRKNPTPKAVPVLPSLVLCAVASPSCRPRLGVAASPVCERCQALYEVTGVTRASGLKYLLPLEL